MRHCFFILIIFLSGCCFGATENKLSNQEFIALKRFIRTLVEDSEAGYVLFNKKPICIHGYHLRDPFCVFSDTYREAITLRRGASIWKKINKENSDIIIHISQKEDPIIRGYVHVLVINIPLFHRVVNDNLSLFQYILGPSITSQKLLNALVYENEPFHALLKYDKVLIGILLGFGTQNSLYVSRMENILEASSKENPPFFPPDLINQEYQKEYQPFPPSFGFKTIQDEIKEYSKKITLSSSSLTEKKPNFIFGLYVNEVGNKKLICDLEDLQDKIKKLICSENFEAAILKQLLGKNCGHLCTVEESNEAIGKSEINEIIAKGIWEMLQYHDFEYLSSFIEGIDLQDIGCVKGERLTYFPDYLNGFIEGKTNLNVANAYFQTIEYKKEFHSVVPFKLYYRTLALDETQKGKCNGSLVTLTYSIYSPLDLCLGNARSEKIDLTNTIPGFSHGIMGMCVGETREILIHPSLAYGFDTSSLDKCIYLRAIVKLEAVHNESSLPKMEPLNLVFLLDPEALQLRESTYKNGLKKFGAAIFAHLRKSKEVNVALIKNYLSQYYSNKQSHTPTTQQEQDQIAKIHWDIYWPQAEPNLHDYFLR